MRRVIDLLQPHTVKLYGITESNTTVEWVSAISLLNSSRFDLFAKIYYIENRIVNKKSALHVYEEHIKAFNPDLKEPGRDDKNGLDDFVSAFERIIYEVNIKGFDAGKSLVPVTEEGLILDGAHRVAACAYMGKKVCVARVKGVKPKSSFDYEYFKSRGLSWAVMDIIAEEMVRYLPSVYVACIWPKAKNKEIGHDIIRKKAIIAYEKTIKVNISSFKNLIVKTYEKEKWVSDYTCVNDKTLQCYGFAGEILFVFFRSENLDDVIKIKEAIRQKYDCGKHSVHITDDSSETQTIAHYVLNDDVRKEWSDESALSSLKEKWIERFYYFRKVQFVNIKVFVAKMIGYKG